MEVGRQALRKVVLDLRPLPLSILEGRNDAVIAARVRNGLVKVNSIYHVAVRANAQYYHVLGSYHFLGIARITLVGTRLTVRLVAEDCTAMDRTPILWLMKTCVSVRILVLRPFAVFRCGRESNRFSTLVFSRRIIPLLCVGIHVLFSREESFLSNLQSYRARWRFVCVIVHRVRVGQDSISEGYGPSMVERSFERLFSFFYLAP